MRPMHSMRVLLIAATWMALHPSIVRADATVWSTNTAACVPVSPSGLHVTAGAVTAGAGSTVTLYCAITRAPGNFRYIEITYRGGGSVLPPPLDPQAATAQASTSDINRMAGLILTKGFASSELIEMSKATGSETLKCGVQSKGSSAIATDKQICNNSNLDFDQNLYYLRIVLKSGIAAGQDVTVYGSSLTSSL